MHKNLIARENFPHMLVVVVLTLLVYLWSAPRTVMLEDDGLFIMASYFNGIAHPPGYPFYTLLGHVMTWLPFGSVAYRVHALSALFGALGCGVLWRVVYKLVPDRACAYAASLLFGFSQMYWSQAIVAEVYTLNVLLILLLLSGALNYVDKNTKEAIRIVKWMGLCYGLGLSNHWPLIILSTPMLLSIMWPERKRLTGQIIYAIPFLLLGLLPYVWMVYRSQMDPEISFYGPVQSWADFWFIISRAGYQQIDQSLSVGWWDKWMYCIFILRECMKQFGLAGAILAVAGFSLQWRMLPLPQSLGLVAGFIGNSFLLVMLLGFDYDLFHRNLFRVYPIVAYCILSIWTAIGLAWLINQAIIYLGGKIRVNLLRSVSVIFLVSLTFMLNVRTNYRAHDKWSENYARAVLDSLALNSIFMAHGDSLIAPLGYLNRVENYRTDIDLYQTLGLVFNNRLIRGHNKITEAERIEILEDFISTREEDVYSDYLPVKNYATEYYGLFTRISKDPNAGQVSFIFDMELYGHFIMMIAAGEPTDPWGMMLYRYQKRGFCYLYSGLSKYTGDKDKQLLFQRIINEHCRDFYGYSGLLNRLRLEDEIDWDIAGEYIANALRYIDQALTKEDAAVVYNFKALMLIETGRQIEAEQVLHQSIRIWEAPENKAYDLLKQLPG